MPSFEIQLTSDDVMVTIQEECFSCEGKGHHEKKLRKSKKNPDGRLVRERCWTCGGNGSTYEKTSLTEWMLDVTEQLKELSHD